MARYMVIDAFEGYGPWGAVFLKKKHVTPYMLASNFMKPFKKVESYRLQLGAYRSDHPSVFADASKVTKGVCQELLRLNGKPPSKGGRHPILIKASKVSRFMKRQPSSVWNVSKDFLDRLQAHLDSCYVSKGKEEEEEEEEDVFDAETSNLLAQKKPMGVPLPGKKPSASALGHLNKSALMGIPSNEKEEEDEEDEAQDRVTTQDLYDMERRLFEANKACLDRIIPGIADVISVQIRDRAVTAAYEKVYGEAVEKFRASGLLEDVKAAAKRKAEAELEQWKLQEVEKLRKDYWMRVEQRVTHYIESHMNLLDEEIDERRKKRRIYPPAPIPMPDEVTRTDIFQSVERQITDFKLFLQNTMNK